MYIDDSMTVENGGSPPATECQIRLDEESQFLEKVRRGDAAACELFVRQHTGAMLAAAKRMLRNEPDAEDAVQDAFIAAFRSLNGFSGQCRVGTWLHRIVVNACLMKLRTTRRKREVGIDELLPLFKEDGHQADPGPDWTLQTTSDWPDDELHARVRACVDELPESYRSVLVLRDIEELDTETTARLLETTVGNVKIRLHRARQALRTLLERMVVDDPHGLRGHRGAA